MAECATYSVKTDQTRTESQEPRKKTFEQRLGQHTGIYGKSNSPATSVGLQAEVLRRKIALAGEHATAARTATTAGAIVIVRGIGRALALRATSIRGLHFEPFILYSGH